jgi:hypothetical protein
MVWSRQCQGIPSITDTLIEVAVRGTEMHPGVAAVIDPGLEQDLHAGRPQLGRRGLDVVDQEPRHRAGGEVAVDRTFGPKDLDLAPVGKLEHPEPGLLQLKAKAQDVSEEGDGGFGVVGSGPDPGQLADPRAWTSTLSRARQAQPRLGSRHRL